MKSFDISLYGHLSFDNIFNGFENTTSVGCMGNVWKSIKEHRPHLRVALQPTAIGESLVMVNQRESKRTSKSCLNLFSSPAIPQSSHIHHVMYLNELKDISFIENLNGFITADVCNGTLLDKNSRFLNKIDLLFISDEDCFTSIKELLRKIPNIIFHRKTGSTLYTGDSSADFNAEIVDNVNVLGLGDKFAAYVLCNLIENKLDVHKSIKPSHDLITYELKKI